MPTSLSIGILSSKFISCSSGYWSRIYIVLFIKMLVLFKLIFGWLIVLIRLISASWASEDWICFCLNSLYSHSWFILALTLNINLKNVNCLIITLNPKLSPSTKPFNTAIERVGNVSKMCWRMKGVLEQFHNYI